MSAIKPLITIVIPVYNVEGVLKECLDSAIHQTLKNIEIICVNDGSTDSSLSILNRYDQEDPRIHIIDKPNTGYGHTMNQGIEQANGVYLAILESDDYLTLNMLEELYKVADSTNHQADFILADACRFFTKENGDKSFSHLACATESQYYRMISPSEEKEVARNPIMHWAGIYKLDFLRKNKIKFNESKGASYQDNGFWFQTLLFAQSIYYVNEEYYMYRTDRQESSINDQSYEKTLCIFSEFEFIKRILDDYPQKKKDYLPCFIFRCVTSFLYHSGRVLHDYKIIFLRIFQEKMKQLMESRELDITLLYPEQAKKLDHIITDPEGFYYETYVPKAVDKISENAAKQFAKFIKTKQSIDTLLRQTEHAEKEPKISIIIPVYNAEAHLGNCLNTALNQTLTDIEVICVNDGSTDNSASILSLYALADERIVLHTQSNQGAGKARNEGLRLSRGEFIAFMDADDWYPSRETLETMYNNAIAHEVEICGGGFIVYQDGKYKRQANIGFAKNELMNYSDYQYDYGYYNYIYKRSLLRDNNITFPAYRRYQDPPFFVNAMIVAGRFYAMSSDFYCYRFGHQNIKWTTEKLADLIRGIIDNLIASREHRLAKLHYECVMRLDRDYRKRIVDNFNADQSILQLLFRAEGLVDTQLIRQVRPDVPEVFNLQVIREALDRMYGKTPITSNAEIKKLKRQVNAYKAEISAINGSASFKIGRMITFVPRQIRTFGRVSKEEGLGCAFKRTGRKIMSIPEIMKQLIRS